MVLIILRSLLQSHSWQHINTLHIENRTLDVISMGREDKSDLITFYNPLTSSYYHPPDFRMDESRLPISNFPNSFRFDGGLTWGLLQNKTDPIH